MQRGEVKHYAAGHVLIMRSPAFSLVSGAVSNGPSGFYHLVPMGRPGQVRGGGGGLASFRVHMVRVFESESGPVPRNTLKIRLLIVSLFQKYLLYSGTFYWEKVICAYILTAAKIQQHKNRF